MPRESHAWATARDELSPFGKLCRVENPLITGYPDVTYCLFGVTGMIETKATVETLKLEQVLFAEEWSRAGGLVFTLLRADAIWFLYDPVGTRQLYERATEPKALVRSPGSFPLREVLRRLAPPGKREIVRCR